MDAGTVGAGVAVVLGSGVVGAGLGSLVTWRVAKNNLKFEREKWEREQFEKEKAGRQELYETTVTLLETVGENLRRMLLRIEYAGTEYADKVPLPDTKFIEKFPPLNRLLNEWANYDQEAASALLTLSEYIINYYTWQNNLPDSADEIDVEDWKRRTNALMVMARSMQRGITAVHNGKWEENAKEVREKLTEAAKTLQTDEADQGSTETPKPED